MKKIFCNYALKVIDRKTSDEFIIKNHYSGTASVSTFSIGLYKDDVLIGVICYGPSSAPPMAKSISNLISNNNYLELQRLFIYDVTEKNTESWFIGQSIKLIRNKYPDVKVIISFADSGEGHVGTIYQATNFLYLGKTDPRKALIDMRTGLEKHPRSLQRLKKNASPKYEEFMSNCVPVVKNGKYRYLLIFDDCIKCYKKLETNEYISLDFVNEHFKEEEIICLFELDKNSKPKKFNIKISSNLKRPVLPYPKKSN